MRWSLAMWESEDQCAHRRGCRVVASAGAPGVSLGQWQGAGSRMETEKPWREVGAFNPAVHSAG